MKKTIVLALGLAASSCGAVYESKRSPVVAAAPVPEQSEVALAAATTQTSAPNIVAIMADDLDTLTFETAINNGLLPNIKTHIVDRGLSFSNNFVTESICCPSRATFLTGQYSHNHGVLAVVAAAQTKTSKQKMGLTYWLDANGNTQNEVNTLPVWLQAAGYRTGLVGKYLNGYGSNTTTTYVPPGYNDWHGLVDPTTYDVYGYTLNSNGVTKTYTSSQLDATVADENYQTDILAEKVKSFVAASATDSAKRPFFLWFTPMAPHIEKGYTSDFQSTNFKSSIRPPLRYRNVADAVAITHKSSVYESGITDKHANIQSLAAVTTTDESAIKQQFRDRLGALKSIDDAVATLVLELKTQGKYDNTILIFTGDNGWHYGEHRLNGKIWPYEESIRVPLVIASPLHPKTGVSDAIVLNNDLAPTIAELGGAIPRVVVDGRSIVPQLNGASSTRKRFLVESFNPSGQAGAGTAPTFGAVRELSSSRNSLYAVYSSLTSTFTTDSSVTFRESYDINADPLQVSGSNVQDATQEARVKALAACYGRACRDAEDDATQLSSQPDTKVGFINPLFSKATTDGFAFSSAATSTCSTRQSLTGTLDSLGTVSYSASNDSLTSTHAGVIVRAGDGFNFSAECRKYNTYPATRFFSFGRALGGSATSMNFSRTVQAPQDGMIVGLAQTGPCSATAGINMAMFAYVGDSASGLSLVAADSRISRTGAVELMVPVAAGQYWNVTPYISGYTSTYCKSQAMALKFVPLPGLGLKKAEDFQANKVYTASTAGFVVAKARTVNTAACIYSGSPLQYLNAWVGNATGGLSEIAYKSSWVTSEDVSLVFPVEAGQSWNVGASCTASGSSLKVSFVGFDD